MEPQNLIDRFNTWIRESVTVKLMSIGILIIILLIPSSWIQSLMEERQHRANEVMDEVYAKWSGSQTFAGPVLVVPYKKIERVELRQGESQMREVTEQAFFLPTALKVAGTITPQRLQRGIFDIVVYESSLDVSATFGKPDFEGLGVLPEHVLWSEAKLAACVSDLRGISETPIIKSGDRRLDVEPSNDIGFNYYNANLPLTPETPLRATGVQAPLQWKEAGDFRPAVKAQVILKGSDALRFLPLGKFTEVSLKGPWPDPSFEGEFLPTTRKISTTDFEAAWKVLHFNRPYPQQWLGSGRTLENYEMATRLIIPADQYQKSIRTAKYSILLILLSFTALLLVEIIRKIRIHPFQYILIGVALIIYYSLLLSMSEHLGYNLAYLIAAVATVLLVTWYSKSFLKEGQLVSLFGGLVTFFYVFVFVIIQAQDFSLLIGSTGLFIVLATIMYFSRSVNWYGER